MVSDRWSDSNGQSDRLVKLSYRWLGSVRWTDRLVKMADGWSDGLTDWVKWHTDGQTVTDRWTEHRTDARGDRWIGHMTY